jgi:hypothetical protein
MQIGKKSNLKSGYVWVPYVISSDVSTISETESFMPKKSLSSRYIQTVASRYGTVMLSPKEKRISKAKKILERIEDFKRKV